jgi:hypothetical protein
MSVHLFHGGGEVHVGPNPSYPYGWNHPVLEGAFRPIRLWHFPKAKDGQETDNRGARRGDHAAAPVGENVMAQHVLQEGSIEDFGVVATRWEPCC